MEQQSSLIDQERFLELREALCEDSILKQILSLFTIDLEQAIENLEEIVKTKDVERLKKICHKLRGSSSNIGALKLRDYAGDLEMNLSQNIADEEWLKTLSDFRQLLLKNTQAIKDLSEKFPN